MILMKELTSLAKHISTKNFFGGSLEHGALNISENISVEFLFSEARTVELEKTRIDLEEQVWMKKGKKGSLVLFGTVLSKILQDGRASKGFNALFFSWYIFPTRPLSSPWIP